MQALAFCCGLASVSRQLAQQAGLIASTVNSASNNFIIRVLPSLESVGHYRKKHVDIEPRVRFCILSLIPVPDSSDSGVWGEFLLSLGVCGAASLCCHFVCLDLGAI